MKWRANYSVITSHGDLAVEECGQSGTPVVFIHGNSSSREVFRHQLEGRFSKHYRLIAFDLPGHGQSGNAIDPVRTYTRPGLADAAVELLERLGATEAVVFGWSLGGHIGIEMLHRLPELRGLMISGTPPVGRNNMVQGFVGTPHAGVAGRQDLSEEDMEAFATDMLGKPVQPFLRDAIARTDTRFRKLLFEAARAGAGVDQRSTVETSRIPLAVVNGAADRLVNLDYVDSLAYANLWEGRTHRLEGLGHAAFWQGPNVFNPILERFVQHAVLPPNPIAKHASPQNGTTDKVKT